MSSVRGNRSLARAELAAGIIILFATWSSGSASAKWCHQRLLSSFPLATPFPSGYRGPIFPPVP